MARLCLCLERYIFRQMGQPFLCKSRIKKRQCHLFVVPLYQSCGLLTKTQNTNILRLPMLMFSQPMSSAR